MTDRTAATAASQTHSRSRDIALIAVFAGLIAVCAILPAIAIGGLVPITLQTFGVILAGAVLGARRGFLAVVLYIAVGALGLPIFANGSAGLEPFVGPSVGYLVAMPFAAALTGALVERLPRRKLGTSVLSISLAGIIASIAVIHVLGIAGLVWRADMTVQSAALYDLAFVPGDIAKAILAALVATAVHRAFPDLLPGRRSAAK